MKTTNTSTRYALIIPDGAADEPLEQLGGCTPLEVANTPNLDWLAEHGQVGLVQTIPPGFEPGSDVASLSLLGYDPKRYYTGRAPLEAASMGVPLNPEDVAFRCNLVSSDGERMLDYSADEVSTPEAHELMTFINERLGSRQVQFYAGVSYRNLMVWRGGSHEQKLTPPHNILSQPLEPHLPEGEGEVMLRRLIWDSLELLDQHPVNQRRRDQGLAPANMIWFWGQGRSLTLPSFRERHGVQGAVVAAVDLMRGICKCAGLDTPTIPGATGNLETDFAAKGRASVALLADHDFVCVHVEAPDEAAHHGLADRKVWAIEQVDDHVVGPILKALREFDRFSIMAGPDHYTPVSLRTHADKPVPFLIYHSDGDVDRVEAFHERAAQEGGRFVEEGYRLIESLFRR